MVLTADYLLTLHQERVSLPAVLAPELPPGRGRRYAVYSVLDAMLASAFDALEELELTLDALAATWTDDDGARAPGGAAGHGRQPGDDAPPGDGRAGRVRAARR